VRHSTRVPSPGQSARSNHRDGCGALADSWRRRHLRQRATREQAAGDPTGRQQGAVNEVTAREPRLDGRRTTGGWCRESRSAAGRYIACTGRRVSAVPGSIGPSMHAAHIGPLWLDGGTPLYSAPPAEFRRSSVGHTFSNGSVGERPRAACVRRLERPRRPAEPDVDAARGWLPARRRELLRVVPRGARRRRRRTEPNRTRVVQGLRALAAPVSRGAAALRPARLHFGLAGPGRPRRTAPKPRGASRPGRGRAAPAALRPLPLERVSEVDVGLDRVCAAVGLP
jgi:hypothetical protein